MLRKLVISYNPLICLLLDDYFTTILSTNVRKRLINYEDSASPKLFFFYATDVAKHTKEELERCRWIVFVCFG